MDGNRIAVESIDYQNVEFLPVAAIGFLLHHDEYRDMLTSIRSNVATLKKQGKSLSDTIAAKPTAAYDAKYGQFLINPGFFTSLVYSGV